MSKISQKLNILLIISVSLSVIVSSLSITIFLFLKMDKDNYEKNMIYLEGLAVSIEYFLDHATTLNYQLSLNPEIRNTIINADPDWDRRVERYTDRYNTDDKAFYNSGYPLLSAMQKKYSFVELFYVQDTKGNQTARSTGLIGQRGNHWWYKAMTENKAHLSFLSNSYFSYSGFKPVASIFHPIMENGVYIGIMGMDINFYNLQKQVESYLQYSSDMYAIITDMNGVIIAHPQSQKISEIYNLINMTHTVLIKKDSGALDQWGYLPVKDYPLDWPDEISSAVSSAVNGEAGYIEDILVDGEISTLYYNSVSLPSIGNEGENYSVLLVHNRSGIIASRNWVLLSIALFVFLTVVFLYLIFRRQFSRNIVVPLDILIKSMKTMDFQNFREIKLETDDEFGLLAGTYNELGNKLNLTNRQLLEKLEYLRESETGYKSFAGIGLAFSKERDVYHLLELILDESRKLTHADGGTFYLYNSETEHLEFMILHTETLDFHMGGSSGNPITLPPVPLYIDGKPNHSNVSSYAALTGELVNISDVYTEAGFDFKGTREYDIRNGYHSQSMLVIPMKNMENELIGVIQLINARYKDTNQVIPFSSANENLSISLASQAAVALTNVHLHNDLENLFNSFIKSIAKAVDEKSTFTGGHIKRVVLMTMMIAREINSSDSGAFSDTFFSDDELEELRIAAWMHDIGKISTPEWLIDKETKLQGYQDGIDLLEMRYKLILQILDPGEKTDFCLNYEELVEELEFLRSCNQPGEFQPEEASERLIQIRDRYILYKGERIPFITDKEFANLSIRKGSLNSEERRIIEHHAVTTRTILAELPFPKHLANVKDYASMHHERLDGSGYPDGLTGDKIPLQARIITVADIFEALTAKDRPYRKPVKLSYALEIMNFMVEDGFIDGDILNFIVDRGLINRYAENELTPEQIDLVVKN